MAAEAKTEDEEFHDVKEPDFAHALSILRSDIAPAEENNASARGDLSAAWKAIEDDCHCNKAAMKQVHKLMNMSDEKRDDYLRTLYGGMAEANIGISQDLVDKMAGKGSPSMPVIPRGQTELHTTQ